MAAKKKTNKKTTTTTTQAAAIADKPTTTTTTLEPTMTTTETTTTLPKPMTAKQVAAKKKKEATAARKAAKEADAKDLATYVEAATQEIDSIPTHVYAPSVAATPDLPHDAVLIYVSLDNLVGHNVRSSKRVAENALFLAGEIRREGLKKPLLVNLNQDLGYSALHPRRIRGDSRRAALVLLFNENPAMFKATFPKGIPCHGISVDKPTHAALMADHGDQKGLIDPIECAETIWSLLDAGHGPTAIVQLAKATLIKFSDRVKKGQSTSWKAALKIRTTIRLYSKSGDKEALALIPGLEKEAQKEEHSALYGSVQAYKLSWDAPYAIECIRIAETGERPATGPLSDPALIVPTMTAAKATILRDAHQLDRAGDATVTKSNPGPLFQAAWKVMVTPKPAAAKGKGTRKTGKSKSRKDIQARATADATSQGMTAILDWASNSGAGKDVDSIAKAADIQSKVSQANTWLQACEWASARMPSEFAAFMSAVAANQAEAATAALKTAQADAASK